MALEGNGDAQAHVLPDGNVEYFGLHTASHPPGEYNVFTLNNYQIIGQLVVIDLNFDDPLYPQNNPWHRCETPAASLTYAGAECSVCGLGWMVSASDPNSVTVWYR